MAPWEERIEFKRKGRLNSKPRIPYVERPPKGEPFITDDGDAICGTHSRRHRGTRCNGCPMENGRCVTCGGKSTGAPLKTGQHSKMWKTWKERMHSKIESARTDPTIFNQQKRTAALAAAYEELEARWLEFDAEPAELWAEAVAAYDRARKHLDAKEFGEAARALDELGQVLRNGRGHDQLFERMEGLATTIAQISRVQHQGLKNAADTLTAREKELFKVRCITEFRGIPLPIDPKERELYLQFLRLFMAAFVKAAG